MQGRARRRGLRNRALNEISASWDGRREQKGSRHRKSESSVELKSGSFVRPTLIWMLPRSWLRGLDPPHPVCAQALPASTESQRPLGLECAQRSSTGRTLPHQLDSRTSPCGTAVDGWASWTVTQRLWAGRKLQLDALHGTQLLRFLSQRSLPARIRLRQAAQVSSFVCSLVIVGLRAAHPRGSRSLLPSIKSVQGIRLSLY